MEINQINLPFVLMDVVQHYIQISKQKREIKILAAIFDGCSAHCSVLTHLPMKRTKIPNGHCVINEIKMRLNFQRFSMSTQQLSYIDRKFETVVMQPQLFTKKFAQ